MSDCWDPSRPSSDWCLGNSLHLRSAERRRRSLLACSADDDVNGIQIYGNIQRNKARFLIVPLNIFVLLAIEKSKVKVFHICFSLRFAKHFRSLTLCVCLRFNLRQFFNSPASTITGGSGDGANWVWLDLRMKENESDNGNGKMEREMRGLNTMREMRL